jgi:hypothetical protein
MKKSISIVLLFTLLIAPIMSVNAQKTRHGLAKTVKPQVTAPSQDTETAFASVSASAAASGVLVKWTMEQEVKNLGFNVFRAPCDGRHDPRSCNPFPFGRSRGRIV